jgi:hypothetical protein
MHINCRAFLRVSSVGRGGMRLGLYVQPKAHGQDAQPTLVPNSFIRIETDGIVTIMCKIRRSAKGSAPRYP